MSLLKINLSQRQLFVCFGLFWIGLGWLALILSLLGIFYASILAGYILLAGAFFAWLVLFNKKNIKISGQLFVVIGATLATIFILSYYTTPTIFSGRDQGSFSETAVRLSENHHFAFSSAASSEFFKIYGPGKALNFPGFNYAQEGSLLTQFPPGYSSWLAIFYSFFGLRGFIAANAISFFIFFLVFYSLGRQFLKPTSALIIFFMALTSFVFSWFFKFTLSENLALMLLWFGIYTFVLFAKNRERFYFISSFLSLGLLLFSRIEALAFLLVLALILLIKYRDWKYLIFGVLGKKAILVILSVLLIYVFHATADSQIYTALIKSVFKPLVNLKKDILRVGGFAQFFFVVKILALYALLGFLVFAAAGIARLFKKRQFEILFPFLICAPTFFYLIQPSITPDHPWMLRRFLFAVIPVCIFYTGWFLDWFFKKRFLFYLLSSALIAANLAITIPYLSFSPNQKLLPQIKELSSNFTYSDLVLVDRLATGDGWSMMTGPMSFLYGKQAVYFLNPKDLDKIDRAKFSKIYFIIPDNNLAFYEKFDLLGKLIPQKDYAIENNFLPPSNSVQLPQSEDIVTRGKIYLYL